MLMDLVREKLSRAFDEREADRIIDETMARVGLSSLETPDDLLVFGTALTQQEGLLGDPGRISENAVEQVDELREVALVDVLGA